MNNKDLNNEEELENEFQDGENQSAEEAKPALNRTLLYAIVGAGIVLIGIGIFLFIRGNAEKEAVEASNALSKVQEYYFGKQYEKAVFGDTLPSGTVNPGLAEIADKYSSTETGKVAAVFAGNAFLELDKPDDAVKYFELAAKSDYKTTQLASASGIAVAKDMSGNLTEAAELYLKASTLAGDDITKYRYEIYAAVCFEKSGNKEKAIEHYTKVVIDNRFSDKQQVTDLVTNAKIGLRRLGTIID